MRLRKGRRIVTTIARHGDDSPFRLHALDRPCLLVRKHVGLNRIDTESRGNRTRRYRVVPGEHHKPQVLIVELLNRARSRGLDWIGHTHEGGYVAIYGEKH